jgi:hypothetical protein
LDPCPSLFMQQPILTPVAKPFMPTHIYLILKQFPSLLPAVFESPYRGARGVLCRAFRSGRQGLVQTGLVLTWFWIGSGLVPAWSGPF